MKNTKGVQAVFTMVGTVVGAGFVSGRELLQFFGCFRISTVYLAGVLFFLSFLLFLKIGGVYGGFEKALTAVFSHAAPLVKGVCYLGSFVSSVGMLSASGALIPAAKPFLPLALLFLTCLISMRGIGGLGALNAVVIPVLFVTVVALVGDRGSLSLPEPNAAGFPAALSVTLYVSMNTFLSIPVLCDLGAGLKKKTELWCLAATALISFGIGWILSAVGSDKSSYSHDLPLAYILNGAPVFTFVALCGIFTTLVSSYYPLYSVCGRRKGGRLALALVTAACSFISFKQIVASVYPMIGVFGAVAILFAAFSYGRKTRRVRRKRRGKIASSKVKVFDIVPNDF